MATRNVVLTPHQEQVIQDLVQSGRYQNASEVMREGLRLLEQRIAEDTAKIEALRQATSIGIMKVLDRINRTGTTVVMATHDAAIVDSMRKRVIELEYGKVVRDQSRGVYGQAY